MKLEKKEQEQAISWAKEMTRRWLRGEREKTDYQFAVLFIELGVGEENEAETEADLLEAVKWYALDELFLDLQIADGWCPRCDGRGRLEYTDVAYPTDLEPRYKICDCDLCGGYIAR